MCLSLRSDPTIAGAGVSQSDHKKRDDQCDVHYIQHSCLTPYTLDRDSDTIRASLDPTPSRGRASDSIGERRLKRTENEPT